MYYCEDLGLENINDISLLLSEEYGITCKLNKSQFDNIVGVGVYVNDTLVSMAFVSYVYRIPCTDSPHGLYGELHGVYTSPEYRNNGYAYMCCEALINKCKTELDYISCYAKCSAKNLYYKLGFINQSDDEMRLWKIL